MTVGLNVTDFQTMFPEFSTVSTSTVQLYINVINYGYQLVSQSISDANILAIYYWLVAHFVAVGTNILGATSTPSPAYGLTGNTTGSVAATFQAVSNASNDSSFMQSTRYGQTYWFLSKQQYLQNFYFNNPWWC